MKRFKKRKCIARGRATMWCDGCKNMGGRCPYRDKYRKLRHTKYGDELYHPYKHEEKNNVDN